MILQEQLRCGACQRSFTVNLEGRDGPSWFTCPDCGNRVGKWVNRNHILSTDKDLESTSKLPEPLSTLNQPGSIAPPTPKTVSQVWNVDPILALMTRSDQNPTRSEQTNLPWDPVEPTKKTINWPLALIRIGFVIILPLFLLFIAILLLVKYF